MDGIKKGRRSDVNEDRGKKGQGEIASRGGASERTSPLSYREESPLRGEGALLRASRLLLFVPRRLLQVPSVSSFLQAGSSRIRFAIRPSKRRCRGTGERLCETPVLPLVGQRRKLTSELPRFPVRSNSFSFAHLPPFPPLDSQKRAFSREAFA